MIMADCKQCLHYEVCADMAEKFIDAFGCGEELSVVCKNFKDRTKWVIRTEAKWIDHGYGVECPVCNHQVNDEYYLGDAVACPNCGALLQPAE
jgi:hypothetical protein